MKRIISFLLALMMAVLCCAAFAEVPDASDTATPTDLDPEESECAHEHTEKTNYFSRPKYTVVNSKTHKVSGSATVVTTCKDCGETISIEDKDYVEEFRFHTFRNGACFLCGALEPEPGTEDSAAESAGETSSASEAGNGGFLAVFDETLTNMTDFGNMFLFGCAGSARCCR